MRILAYILGGLVLLVAIVYAVGALLPEAHTASVRARIPAGPDSVWTVLADVRAATTWRSGLESAEVVSEQPLRWRETSGFGTIGFEREVSEPPHRLSARIIEADGFGGTWTWVIEPDGDGSIVTVTEAGEVYNPLFRFLSRFVFGHHGGMETYLRDLGRRFGAETATERVE